MKYAFLGAGKMAQALIEGMLAAQLCPAADITASDRYPESLRKIEALGVRAATTNSAAAVAADAIILCVKPTDVATALGEAGEAMKGKLLISIAAGVKIAALERSAPGSRVIRVMPNTAALVQKSATAIAVGASATVADGETARKIFQAVGSVFFVPEAQLDAITGLSGSGPAYIYFVLEAMREGGAAVGLDRDQALQLSIQTLAGAAEMAARTGRDPAELREMVTSPNGTTFAGLNVLRDRQVDTAFVDTIKAATRRSEELSGS